MMKLIFYYGPGNLVTKIIRLLTHGPYSHVELQFTDGCRFFSSGHGLHTGGHMICDRKVYDQYWDQVLIPATYEQEKAAERFIFHLIGFPFDWRGMIGFLIPFFDRRRKAKYCSSIILEVLQQSLHMFPGIELKISPNGLYRLFVSRHPLLISAPAPEEAVVSAGHDADPSSPVNSPAPDTPGYPGPSMTEDANPLIGPLPVTDASLTKKGPEIVLYK
jgi:hypothetical protein